MTITVRIPDKIWQAVEREKRDRPHLSKNAIIVELLAKAVKP